VVLRAYQTGELDLINVGAQDMPLVRGREDLHVQPLPVTIGLQYYLPDPVLSDFNVRLALSRAIDRDLFTQVMFNGAVVPTTNWVPADEPGANEAGVFEQAIGFDPEAARTALARAGYPGGASFPGVSLLIRDDATDRSAAEFLQNVFREHPNINLSIETVDSPTLQQRLNEGKFQLALAGSVNAASRSAACWMSYRYFFASSRIKQSPGLLDRLSKIWVLDRRGDDEVHRPLE
jgi:oligopeptide transport system substrate-binding protein